MPLVTTRAVILHGFPYSETSKIVRLLTPDHGVQSAIAKGALKPRSRFGARLEPLSEGTAQLYMKAGRDLHTLAEFEVTVTREVLAQDVTRFAAASALAELVMRCAGGEPHPEIVDLLGVHLDRLGDTPREELTGVALAALWAVVAALGFAPVTTRCARAGHALPEGAVAFSVADGGFVCALCARSGKTTTLSAADRATLEGLVSGIRAAGHRLSPRHAAAHRRLLRRFVQRHVAEAGDLKALSLWERLG